MSTRSTAKEHTRRIHEARYLLDSGCSKAVASLILQARYKISREAARVLSNKAEALGTEPIPDINYSSLINRINIEIENTLYNYSSEKDTEKKESTMRSFEKLVKALEKISTLSDTYIIDAAKY